jgi:uncharacterized ubiquitin-like protein YukD
MEQINAFREQQIINTRILAMKQAMKLAAMSKEQVGGATAEKVIEDATKLADYYIADLDGLKKKSGLVVTSVMPPAAAGFKPGAQ